ncbi:nucleotidyl cyclase domain-containing protein [Ferrimonas marina]|uniref:Uncharacterized protein n=1 Tax=Ferrimonas marina TaxID=299255 RepID=A0A1M5NB27_9GAMM|nr:hypothetical protein [Ferrimonas marina]SHG86691.1 hypothetical protein SAMN02745129_0967 [Ferrimonas marina]
MNPDAWRILAQAASGNALLQAVNQACFRATGWPIAALAQRLDDQVRLVAISDRGQLQPTGVYPLEQAPCQLLYRPHHPEHSHLLCGHLERFPLWRLRQQWGLQSYYACRIDTPLGEFHLFLADRQRRAEQELPRTLLNTAAQRIAADLVARQQQLHQQQLEQALQVNPQAFVRIDPQGRMRDPSYGLSALWQCPLADLQDSDWTRWQQHRPALLGPLVRGDQPSSGPAVDGYQAQLLPIDPASGHLLVLTPSQANALPLSQGLPNQQDFRERLRQELARLARNQQVAALIFIQYQGEHTPPWPELAADLRQVLRSEDVVAQLDANSLALLTACFDHHGEAPRQQIQAIANKVDKQVSQWIQACSLEGESQLAVRLITQWDHDLTQLLDPEEATRWSLASPL